MLVFRFDLANVTYMYFKKYLNSSKDDKDPWYKFLTSIKLYKYIYLIIFNWSFAPSYLEIYIKLTCLITKINNLGLRSASVQCLTANAMVGVLIPTRKINLILFSYFSNKIKCDNNFHHLICNVLKIELIMGNRVSQH